MKKRKAGASRGRTRSEEPPLEAAELEAILDRSRVAAGLSPVAIAALTEPRVVTPAPQRDGHARSSQADLTARTLPRPKHRADQLLVTIDPGVISFAGSGRRRAVSARLVESVEGPFAALERDGLVESVTAVAPTARAAAGGGPRSARAIVASVQDDVDPDLVGVNVLRLAPGARMHDIVWRLQEVRAVRLIERVPYRTIAPPSRPRPLPLDPTRAGTRRPRPWNLDSIGWQSMNPPNARGVRVAVLDTGVDAAHPDLTIATYEHGEASAEDIVGHGTHVCGIIAGLPARRGAFVGGVSNAALHVWKIFGDERDESGAYLVDEVLYQRALLGALRSGCRVVNLTIGGEGTTRTERALFKRLVDGGVVVVAAIGDAYTSGNPVEFPAAHEGVIAVGAVGRDLARASFSSTGDHLALVAPGVDILSTLPRTSSIAREETNYAVLDGTSTAAPHVTGAVARVLARSPRLGPAEVRRALAEAAKPLPAMRGHAWTRVYGAGLLQL